MINEDNLLLQRRALLKVCFASQVVQGNAKYMQSKHIKLGNKWAKVQFSAHSSKKANMNELSTQRTNCCYHCSVMYIRHGWVLKLCTLHLRSWYDLAYFKLFSVVYKLRRHSQKNWNPKPKTFFFIVNLKTCRVFWGFEQFSSTIA